MEEFKIGDTVYHKSNGSLAMIVVGIDGNDVECRWVETNQKSKGHEVHIETFIIEELTTDSGKAWGGFVI